jgi:hypothetical protein
MPLRTVEISNIDAMQAALNDPGAFEGNDAAEFLAFLAVLRKINRYLYENTVGEGDQGLLSINALRLPQIDTAHQLAIKQSQRMWSIAVGHVPSASEEK